MEDKLLLTATDLFQQDMNYNNIIKKQQLKKQQNGNRQNNLFKPGRF